MFIPRLPLPLVPRQPLSRLGWLLGLTALLSGPAAAQHIPIRPDSVVVPSSAAVPDTARRPAALPEPPPDAEPTPGPVSGRARWTILGACALLTLSTLLLYNVRSR